MADANEPTLKLGGRPNIFMEPFPEGADVRAPLGYYFSEEIGSGGWGTVFSAYPQGQVRTVVNRRAVKVITKPYPFDKQLGGEFYAHELLQKAAPCPWIARVYSAGRTLSRHPYFMMEFVGGVRLFEELSVKPSYQRVREVVRVFRDILRGVDYIAGLRLVHRDLKPANIMILPEGIPKTIDFGLATLMERRYHEVAVLRERRQPGRRINGTVGPYVSKPGEYIEGTPTYMSPEQAGSRQLDERSDVFTVALLLQLALTKEYDWCPYAPQSRESLTDRANLTTPIPRADLSQIRKGAELSALLERMLDPDPTGRPWPCNAVVELTALLEERGALESKGW